LVIDCVGPAVGCGRRAASPTGFSAKSSGKCLDDRIEPDLDRLGHRCGPSDEKLFFSAGIATVNRIWQTRKLLTFDTQIDSRLKTSALRLHRYPRRLLAGNHWRPGPGRVVNGGHIRMTAVGSNWCLRNCGRLITAL
jgi:hypothetical protein